MDEFDAARLAGLAHLQERQGIGTLGERSLHSILKYWSDSDDSHHEVTLGLGRIVADVFDGQQVVEIQTRSFNALRPKLDRMLPLYPVTVVYPIARMKYLIWINPETGESSPPRKSPRKGKVWDAFFELYKIRSYLTNPGLTIRLVLLDMEEYKLLNGWSQDKKKGSHRMERIPVAFCEAIDLHMAEDYAALLPADLPRPFTSMDMAKKTGISKYRATEAVNVLYNINAIIRVGKKGNAFLYDLP